ncbi:MAG: acyl-CoA dehydrogenase [Robiginitomaculum sp.]|nr:MAG: acyl-CoA dehydrogenase [Robiginitomaculum sp.]
MMHKLADISLSEMQAEMADLAARFCTEKSPIEKVRALLGGAQGYSESVWSEIAALGLTGIAIPSEFGGSGLGLAEVVPVVEHMGRTLMAGPYMDTILAASIINMLGSETQKKNWLPQICAGRTFALALSEAHADWDLSNITTKASSNTSGFVLSGGKRLVNFADTADFILVTAVQDGTPALIVLARKDVPSASLRRENIIDETTRSYSLNLDGLNVSADAFISHKDMPSALAQMNLAANLLNAALMVGGTKAALDLTIEYANTRTQFGRPIGAYQAVKHPLVDAWIGYEKARALLYSAAHNFDEKSAETAVLMARVKAETAFAFAADRSIQFHGATGFTHDCDAGLYRRRALYCASRYGDAAFQKRKLADLLFA